MQNLHSKPILQVNNTSVNLSGVTALGFSQKNLLTVEQNELRI